MLYLLRTGIFDHKVFAIKYKYICTVFYNLKNMSHFADKCANRVAKLSYKIMYCTESKFKVFCNLSQLIAFENIRNRIKTVLVLQGI